MAQGPESGADLKETKVTRPARGTEPARAESVDALRATLMAQGVPELHSASETIGLRASESIARLPSLLPKAVIGEGGDFEPREELGRGGIGVVELARQRSLNRDVAIKRLVIRDAKQESVLLHEATIAGQLEHPNIVPVHLVVDDDRGPAVIMKRISGVEWAELLDSGDTPLERHLEILAQVSNAVAFAHSRGIIHRDIKPSNVMIGEFDEVYLVDWGLGRMLKDGSCRTDGIAGTPAYMPPEMVRGEADVRSDVFLLGAALHELLTGRPRHEGDNVVDVLSAAFHCVPATYDDALPADLVTICRRSCTKLPAERFETAAEFRDAIRRYLKLRSANRLLRVAEARAQALERECAAGADYADAQRLFNEARFAFEQALTAWPDNPVAIEGQRACMEQMIRYELDIGHPENASALLTAMANPNVQLIARLETLRAAREAERERVKKLEHDRDPSVGAEARTAAALVLAALVVVLVGVFVTLRILAPEYASAPIRLLLVGGVVLAVGGLVVMRWRRQSEFNLINLRIAQIVIVTLMLSLFNRGLGLLRGAAAHEILETDALILLGCGLALTPFHRSGTPLALMALIVSIVGALQNSWLEPMFIGIAAMVSLAVLVASWRRKAD